ncbi:MAG: DUF1385 domain-containing protein [Coriobacteriaceae bacterium]|nr:DUF1385 domain-containing protein [Coriobacteriaceae bacterium]
MSVSQVETLHAQEEGALESPLIRPVRISRIREAEAVVCQTHIGGQALIEGVMMRGRYNWAVAVRTPEGTIYTEEHDLASGRDKNSWMYKPVIRGCTAMVESLALGFKALEIAAEHAFDLSDEEEKEKAKKEKKKAKVEETEEEADEAEAKAEIKQEAEEAGLPKALMTISMFIGVVLGVVIFVVLPAVVTNLIVGDYGDKTLLWNVVDGILRIAIFVFYIWLIGRMNDIKRMFAYHGAEHKTIHCYEHGLELTTDNARQFTTFHVRCGTAFLLMTMLVAIFVFTVFPITAIIDALGVSNDVARLALLILSRIILIPLIAGLSYEVTVKWAGSRPNHPLVRLILWPGLQMQRLTTNQPDDSMIECAIAAMQRVLVREQKERATQKTGI